MSEVDGSRERPQPQRLPGRGHRGRRGGRGGRGRARGQSSSPRGDIAPTQDRSLPAEAPLQQPSRHQGSSEPRGDPRRGRGRRGRGQRPGDRLITSPQPLRPASHRSFGGHLTRETPEAPLLSPDAPEFVPGRPVETRRQARAQAPKQPQVRLPKSTAEDLATRIHEDISNYNYECAICTDDVLRTSHVWSCVLCWTVVHLKCARRWHDNQKKQADCQSAEPQIDPSWRCPACNSKLLDAPGSYHCCCAERPTMRTAGAATSRAKICCPAASTLVANLATPDSAAIAKPRSRPGAIAAASRSSSLVRSGPSLVSPIAPPTMPGLRAPSSAKGRARGTLTVVFTNARDPATPRTSSHRTAPTHQMSSPIAPVARRHSTNC
ncbi:hypothetical protein XA68_12017 [Ophiocordyceps unilateralis]|uniref:RING-type domain-containing protein n=1 Tax=Ophiocordyceps unilateralis TaxID=268505 RepID=A0A2A9PEQ6_OPHUN|nr:hypothetical protein XA68_12017 [Ophiocordyceps unilateralis]